jgi:regulator of cell morphogenesis and NO signaling
MTQSTLTSEMTVGSVVVAYPVTMRMLESLGIDYCCGGKRTLADAARGAHLPVESLIAVLNTTIAQAGQAPATERDWQTATLDELMAHIVDVHHTFMHREVPRIADMMARVVRAHGPNHGDVLQPLADTFAALREEIEAHLVDEEERTFPLIRRLIAGQRDPQTAEAVRELEQEHDAAGEALARMREVTHNYQVPADACPTFCGLYDALQELERDLHRHIHLENNILFPRTRQVLAQEEAA